MSQLSNRTSTGQGMNDKRRSKNENATAARVKSWSRIGWFVFAAAMLLIAPAVGSAQSDIEKDTRQGFVDRFDQDGDASVSQDEFTGPDEHFSRMDSDGDGFIDAGEAPNGPPEGKGGGFEQDDQDDDGRVSRDEFSGPSDHFDKMDQDQDGYVDRDEGHHGPRGGRGGGRGPRN